MPPSDNACVATSLDVTYVTAMTTTQRASAMEILYLHEERAFTLRGVASLEDFFDVQQHRAVYFFSLFSRFRESWKLRMLFKRKKFGMTGKGWRNITKVLEEIRSTKLEKKWWEDWREINK